MDVPFSAFYADIITSFLRKFNIISANNAENKELISANTCSPIGTVVVSVALATAAVAADIIPQALSQKDTSASMLSQVQQLRQADVKQLQTIQRQLSRRLMSSPPLPVIFNIAIQLGLLTLLPRKLVTYAGDYPLSASLRFDYQKHER